MQCLGQREESHRILLEKKGRALWFISGVLNTYLLAHWGVFLSIWDDE